MSIRAVHITAGISRFWSTLTATPCYGRAVTGNEVKAISRRAARGRKEMSDLRKTDDGHCQDKCYRQERKGRASCPVPRLVLREMRKEGRRMSEKVYIEKEAARI